MKPILEVKGLWKEYQRGAQKEKYLSLRDSLFKSLKPKAKKESFWALQDINFEVYPGDSLAIIGKNGAGKSTLLKILSKITPPTRGEVIIRGRLASLLEVGTGFHQELTGRENIYLNGSILGLGRDEINRQFDAIVDFSGVEAFLDTPLKHYSSGMQLRLAFAVAAHLEPEILVIDEVLAVGDSTFQQKCINKMTEVSRAGRTILFVSHNMQAVKNICTRAILISDGRILMNGETNDLIKSYLMNAERPSQTKTIDCAALSRKRGKGELKFSYISSDQWTHLPEDVLEFSIKLKSFSSTNFKDLLFGINIFDREKQCIYHLSNIFVDVPILSHEDRNVYRFSIRKSRLKSGIYTASFFIRANEEIQDWTNDEIVLEVLDGNAYGFNNSKMITGAIQPDYKVYVEQD